MDIFWLFLMLSALQPVIKQRLLEATRKRLIVRIESERHSRVILLVHRQETMSLLGFPVLRYIARELIHNELHLAAARPAPPPGRACRRCRAARGPGAPA